NLFWIKRRFRDRLVETLKLFAVKIGHALGKFVTVIGARYFVLKSFVFGIYRLGCFDSQVRMFFGFGKALSEPNEGVTRAPEIKETCGLFISPKILYRDSGKALVCGK